MNIQHHEHGCVQLLGREVRVNTSHNSWALLPTNTGPLPGKWTVHCPGGIYNEFDEELVGLPWLSRRFRTNAEALDMFNWLTSRL